MPPLRPTIGASARTALLLAAALVVPAGAQTAMFRGDPAHTGRYHGGGATLEGLAWRAETGGDVDSSPAIAGGVVYVGSNDGRLYAFDLATGATRWSRDLGAPVNASPAVDGGRVFVQTRAGVLYGLSAADGSVRWRVPTGRIIPLPWGHESGDYFTSSPVIANGTVIFGAGDGGVYALDPATGARRWRATTGGRIRGTPAVADGLVYVGSYDGRVYAFDAATGARRWVYETEGTTLNSADWGFDRRSIQASPVVAGGTVYVGARDGFIYALDAATGDRRWRYDHKISWIITSPAAAGGVIYAGSSDAHFCRRSTARPRTLARQRRERRVEFPALTDSMIYFGDGAGVLTAVDRASGAVRWSFHTRSQVYSSPAVDGAYVVVGSTDGSVYALRAGNGPAVHRAVFYDSTLRAHAHAANAGAGTVPRRSRLHPARLRRPRRIPGRAHVGPGAERGGVRDGLRAGVRGQCAAGPLAAAPVSERRGQGGLDATAAADRARRMPEGKLAFNWELPGRLTGVPLDSALFDRHGVRATAEGRRWGLPERWRGAWAVGAAGVSRVLAFDDEGHASAWVRNYGGPEGTGWVVVPVDDPMAVYLVAERRGARR